MVDATKSTNTPPVDLPARKIMRRGDGTMSGTNTGANSENPSKATSEADGSDGGNDNSSKKDKSVKQGTERLDNGSLEMRKAKRLIRQTLRYNQKRRMRPDQVPLLGRRNLRSSVIKTTTMVLKHDLVTMPTILASMPSLGLPAEKVPSTIAAIQRQ
jgi:hypothetical protein